MCRGKDELLSVISYLASLGRYGNSKRLLLLQADALFIRHGNFNRRAYGAYERALREKYDNASQGTKESSLLTACNMNGFNVFTRAGRRFICFASSFYEHANCCAVICGVEIVGDRWRYERSIVPTHRLMEKFGIAKHSRERSKVTGAARRGAATTSSRRLPRPYLSKSSSNEQYVTRPT